MQKKAKGKLGLFEVHDLGNVMEEYNNLVELRQCRKLTETPEYGFEGLRCWDY